MAFKKSKRGGSARGGKRVYTASRSKRTAGGRKGGSPRQSTIKLVIEHTTAGAQPSNATGLPLTPSVDRAKF